MPYSVWRPELTENDDIKNRAKFRAVSRRIHTDTYKYVCINKYIYIHTVKRRCFKVSRYQVKKKKKNSTYVSIITILIVLISYGIHFTVVYIVNNNNISVKTTLLT